MLSREVATMRRRVVRSQSGFLSRRELLRAGASASVALQCAMSARTASGDSIANATLDGKRLFADVAHYSTLGEHRTATESDVATSKWLADELRPPAMPSSCSHSALSNSFPPRRDWT